MNIHIEKYTDEYENRWDRFIERSLNGTFLQSRNFLNYHPENRFKDASLMIMNGNEICAVIPACDCEDEGKRTFFSHKGSTFGGLIVDKNSYCISFMEEVIPMIDEFLQKEGYEKVILKQTPQSFTDGNMELIDYELFKNGYNQYNELSFCVDCKKIPENNPEAIMSFSRRRDYRYSLKNNFLFRELSSDSEIKDFYQILQDNLKKHDAIPVHTIDELIDFKNNRLKEQVKFFGVFYSDKIIAGSMVFFFGRKVIHTQYLAADAEHLRQFSMNYLNYNLILQARNDGFETFSFGISTENRGKILNMGLALFKEGFGCEYSVNRTFIKEY